MAVDVPRNRRPKQTTFIESKDDKHWFDFRCKCGAWGHLGVDAGDMTPFGCPEGCGATFVCWIPKKTPVLKCVVEPMCARVNDDERYAEPEVMRDRFKYGDASPTS